MQILILSSKFPYPFKDGGAIATYQIYKGLKSNAKVVHLLSFNTVKHFVEERKIPKELFPLDDYSLINIDTRPRIIKALFNLLFSKKPYILERFHSNEFVNKLVEKIRENSFDIVQIEGLYLLQYIEEIRAHTNTKIVYRAHNLESEIWNHLAQKEKNILKKKYLSLLAKRINNYEKSMINSYDMLVPISNEDAEEYLKLGNKKPILVVPIGFNFLEQKKSNAIIPKSLCYIGSLDWRPNQDGILWFLNNCWNQLQEIYPDLKLYIAGRNAPEWLVQKFSLPGIYWVGEVESSAEFIKNKTIMIVPLQSGSGMRVKIIEGFFLSKAIIATNIAVQGSGAENEKHLLIADEPQEFINGIIKYLSNVNFLKEVSRNGYNYGKLKFDNKIIAKKIFNFYKTQISN